MIAHLDDGWGPFEGLGRRLTGRGTADIVGQVKR